MTPKESTLSLWDTGNDLEEVNAILQQVENLLQIYDEHIEDELAFVGKSGAGIADYLVARYDLLRSLLWAIQTRTHDAVEALKQPIAAIYAASKTAT